MRAVLDGPQRCVTPITAAALLVGAMAVPAMPAAGQLRRVSPPLLVPPAVVSIQPTADASGHPSWLPPLASLAAPGSGQFLTGVSRGALYVITEAFLLTTHLSEQRVGRSNRDRFRDLAFRVARGPFGPGVRDTAFQYFEQMAKFVESGPFDVDARPGIQPPRDERTFNGSIWALARQTFLSDPNAAADPASPAYQRALEFYRRRAVGPGFLWSWRGADVEYDLFKQAIRRSNDAFRRGSAALGFLVANHLLSFLDAFVSQRLSSPDRPTTLESRLMRRAIDARSPRLEWTLRVSF